GPGPSAVRYDRLDRQLERGWAVPAEPQLGGIAPMRRHPQRRQVDAQGPDGGRGGYRGRGRELRLLRAEPAQDPLHAQSSSRLLRDLEHGRIERISPVQALPEAAGISIHDGELRGTQDHQVRIRDLRAVWIKRQLGVQTGDPDALVVIAPA